MVFCERSRRSPSNPIRGRDDMGVTQFHDDGRFTPATRASMSLLFDRMARDGILPLVFYSIDRDGRPLAVFSQIFGAETTERLGAAITEAMIEAQNTLGQ
jgi:hypothetical protein